MFGSTPREKAFFAPFAVFLGFLALNELIGKIFDGLAGFWMWTDPPLWIFPLQTLVCGWLLWRWRGFYPLRPPALSALAAGILVGVFVFVIWIAPQAWLGRPARLQGFDPTFFGTSGWPFVATVTLRFLRLVVVVPLVEEIFWRGYVLRVLIAQPFDSVPFGTFSWTSFAAVTAGFCLEHQPADWPAAAAAGVLYNLLACRTRSLGACVLAHAVTNLLLGLFVMRSGQWGFW